VHALPSSHVVPVSSPQTPFSEAPAATEQASQAPAAQTSLQHTPSAQKPLPQSLAFEHGAPGGSAKPFTTITRLPPPNVEKRKSPVTGSMTAPSAPVSPVMKVRRVVTSGLLFPSSSNAPIWPAEYSETSMLGLGKSVDPMGT
jgi:hypothetical protein